MNFYENVLFAVIYLGYIRAKKLHMSILLHSNTYRSDNYNNKNNTNNKSNNNSNDSIIDV
jgi:hypothetical protein